MEEKGFDTIVNIERYHKAKVLCLILRSMYDFAGDIFGEIENVYECGEEIPQKEIDKLIEEIHRGLDTLKTYLWLNTHFIDKKKGRFDYARSRNIKHYT